MSFTCQPQEATSYNRADGYFSSAAYHVLALAFSDFIWRAVTCV